MSWNKYRLTSPTYWRYRMAIMLKLLNQLNHD